MSVILINPQHDKGILKNTMVKFSSRGVVFTWLTAVISAADLCGKTLFGLHDILLQLCR